ncbi:hypothetical protein MASR2M74_34190 [Paracoccaceae bacterium]
MSWRAGLLLSGCLEELANTHLLPYAVYCGDRLTPLTTRQDMLHALEGLYLRLMALGARRLQPRITTLGLPRGRQQRLWVEWEATLADGSCQVVARTVEYLRDTGEGLRGEMTEYTCLLRQAA